MAQLIKLRDYISRYEWNTYRYPSQYIRLKQDNWKKLHNAWMNETDDTAEQWHTGDTVKSKWNLFKKFHTQPDEQPEKKTILPETKEELKYYFLDGLMPFQLKWTTSTVTDVSFMDRHYDHDRVLQTFLQRIPDTFLVMYYPVFNIKKASVKRPEWEEDTTIVMGIDEE